MNFKHKLLKPGLLLLVLFSFLIGQDAWAAVTFTSAGTGGNWTSSTSWTNDGGLVGAYPGSGGRTDDIVVIAAHTITLDQNAQVASLTLNAGTSILTVGAGDTVSLTVNGAVNLSNAGAGVRGVANTTGRINLTIGGTSTVTNTVAANGSVGLNVHNITIANANVSYVGDFAIRVTGDFAMTGTSSFTPAANTNGTLTFQGGYETIQNISVSSDSYCELVNLTTANGADVVTASDMTIRELLTIATPATESFTATAGTITFTPNAALACVVNTLVTTNAVTNLKFNDVLFNCAGANATPATSFIVGGDFTKIGGNNFAPTAGIIVFENADPVGKNIQFLGGTNNFFGLAIGSAPNFKFTKVKTTSDFSLTSTATAIDVVGTSSFIAEAGTISIAGATGVIANSADGTLKFNNLTMAAAATGATTASSFTINGNLSITAAAQLVASAGTITFENSLQRTITNNGGAETDLTFFGLKVAESSNVTTATDFTVIGDLTLSANSVFTATANEVYWGGATTKTITVPTTANLEFFDFIVNTGAGTVQTAGSFTVNGTAFTITDNTCKFEATGGTVTFTANAVLTCDTDGKLIFWNVTVDGSDVTDAGTPDFVSIKGNLTVNGASGSFISASGSTVTFLGTTNSIIGGNSAINPPVTFDVLVINKTGATGSDEVQLATNMSIVSTATSTITLTDGILNMGSATMTVGANVLLTQGTGAINGGTGTYVIATGHIVGLTDDFFTVNGTPTLYNLTVGLAHTTGAALTINGDLDWTAAAALTIANPGVVTLYGNLKQTAAGTIVASDPAASVLILKGSGTAAKLDNAILTTMPSLTFERGETLTGALTMVASNVFTMNSSINVLNLGVYTLTLDNATVLNLISGSIKADLGTVVLGTDASQTTIPANLFTSNTVNNLTIAAATTLGSDLTVNGTLTGLFQITTNDNTLTFGPSSTMPAYVAGTHIVGNMAQTVTSTAKVFHVGGGAAATYRPVAINFATLGSTQVMKVSSALTSPTVGRAGDPARAINSVWTITPTGAAPADSMRIDYGWGATQDNGLATGTTTTFAARWNDSYWRDYRNEYSVEEPNVTSFVAASELGITAGRFPIDADSISGTWAVFVASADGAESAAITNSSYKMSITNVSPNPVRSGFPFSVTVQLQDRYGNPVAVPTADGAYTVNLTTLVGTALTGTPVPVVIPVGESMATVSGLSIAAAAGESGTQLMADLQTTTSLLGGVINGISAPMSILADQPTAQVSGITLSTGQATSTTLTYTLANPAIVIAKAGSAITEADFPVDGTTYYANTIFGSGSAIGDAVVVYKAATAPGTAVTINGLAPNTTYYFRAFAYSGSNGAEKYLTFSAANNPKSVTTSGDSDDDEVYGNNDTRTLARPIGTNSVIAGRIDAAADEDWFSFAVTSISPNIRARLYDLPGNYTIELYDMTGRRIRRSTLSSTSNEALIANALPAGTYTVRILSADGSYYSTTGDEYYLKVTTSGSEIFSVTP